MGYQSCLIKTLTSDSVIIKHKLPSEHFKLILITLHKKGKRRKKKHKMVNYKEKGVFKMFPQGVTYLAIHKFQHKEYV